MRKHFDNNAPVKKKRDRAPEGRRAQSVSNLIELELGGKALCDSVDEVGEGEGSATVPEREEALFSSAAKDP